MLRPRRHKRTSRPPAHPRTRIQKSVKRAEEANAINLLLSGEVLEGGEHVQWEGQLQEVPVSLSESEKEWLMVAGSSDASFPSADNVHWVRKSGVMYLAAPSGSVMDECIKAADEHEMVFAHTSLKLLYHQG